MEKLKYYIIFTAVLFLFVVFVRYEQNEHAKAWAKTEIAKTRYMEVISWVTMYPELRVMLSSILDVNKGHLSNEDYVALEHQYEHLEFLRHEGKTKLDNGLDDERVVLNKVVFK